MRCGSEAQMWPDSRRIRGPTQVGPRWRGGGVCAAGEDFRRGGGPPAVCCSDACRARHWQWARRARARVAALRGESLAARMVCPECGIEWTNGLQRWANAVYCSAKCRTRGDGATAFAKPSP